METPDRKPGSWTKTPSERLAASKTRSSQRGSSTSSTRTRSTSARQERTERPAAKPRRSATTTKQTSATGSVFSIGGVDISVRLLFIIIMVSLLLSLVAPSVLQWIRQEQNRRDVLAELEQARARQSDIERKIELWKDPEYVTSQARERLGFVKPGETQYSVIDPGAGYQDLAQVAAAAPKGPARPWMQNFVLLTQLADRFDDVPATQNVVRTPEPSDQQQSPQSN